MHPDPKLVVSDKLGAIQIDYNTERPHSSLKYQAPEEFAAALKRNGRSRLSYLMAPRLRPLLTPPNDGTKKKNKLDLLVALKKGAGHKHSHQHGLLTPPAGQSRQVQKIT